MSSGVLEEVLREVRLVHEKVERLEELVEERHIGLEEPLKDELRQLRSTWRPREREA